MTGRFLEVLPEGCPPSAAWTVEREQVVFRFVKTLPPALDDFASHHARGIAKPTDCPCRARGLSVLATDDLTVVQKLKKLQFFKNKEICRVRLDAGAGKLQQTSEPPHHTWWPFDGFDILAHCEVATP